MSHRAKAVVLCLAAVVSFAGRLCTVGRGGYAAVAFVAFLLSGMVTAFLAYYHFDSAKYGPIVEEVRLARERAEAEQSRIRTTGRRGRGAIQRVTDLRGRINHSIQALVDFQIAFDDLRSSRYPTSIETYVPPLATGRLVPGSSIPVAIDPDCRENIVILWEEP